MTRSRKVEHVVVLRSPFRLGDRRVFFGRARLLPDRILLNGLGYRRRILLDDIEEIRWVANELTLVLKGGEEVFLIIRNAALWKYELQSRCGMSDAGRDMTVQALNARSASKNGPPVPTPTPDKSREEKTITSDRRSPQEGSAPEAQDASVREEKEGNSAEDDDSTGQGPESRPPSYRISNGYRVGRQLELGDTRSGDGASEEDI